MQKTYCDRCGVEMHTAPEVMIIRKTYNRLGQMTDSGHYDLCEKCDQCLELFLKGGEGDG